MLPKPIQLPLAIALSAALAACSSSTSSQTPPDASATDARADGSPTMPFACGTATCNAGQWCVQECSCGGAVACNPTDDAGACPDGSMLQTCGASGHMGCIIPCNNPPPGCQGSIPPACYDTGGGMVQCACPG
jgi:hypothetical protein